MSRRSHSSIKFSIFYRKGSLTMIPHLFSWLYKMVLKSPAMTLFEVNSKFFIIVISDFQQLSFST
jgi:hypothetical protein